MTRLSFRRKEHTMHRLWETMRLIGAMLLLVLIGALLFWAAVFLTRLPM